MGPQGFDGKVEIRPESRKSIYLVGGTDSGHFVCLPSEICQQGATFVNCVIIIFERFARPHTCIGFGISHTCCDSRHLDIRYSEHHMLTFPIMENHLPKLREEGGHLDQNRSAHI